MDGEPLVSVVIPAYNAEKYVAEAVDTVLAETYDNIEVIIVDDGSTDQTAERVKPFLEDPRVKYIRQPNAGPAAARNRAIRETRGELIAFLDADDRWEPRKLERQVPLFRNPKVGMVYCPADEFTEDGRDIPSTAALEARRGRAFWDILLGNFVVLSSAVVRKSCIENVGDFDPSLPTAEDTEFYARVTHDYELDYVDEPLFQRRLHGENLSLRDDVPPTTLAALRKVAELYPECSLEVSPRMRRIYADRARGCGYDSLYAGRSRQARHELWEACKYRPGRLSNWIYLAAACLPGGFYRLLRAVKRRCRVPWPRGKSASDTCENSRRLDNAHAAT
jgi:glycosyltransferase involved in cell wall biosynthesis